MNTLGMAHKTPADGLMDFVHVMMHEVSISVHEGYDVYIDSPSTVQLTHTKAGGLTHDSGKPGIRGWIGKVFFNKDSYGWSNCVGLKSARNADS